MNQKIIIFDTTLRDGEQALQSTLNSQEKLKIAFALEKLGVDIIEVGFPISSPGDFKSVEIIAHQIKNTCVCGLARCINNDIDVAAQALQASKNFRIHIFLGTSNIHIYSKLKKDFKKIVEMATYSIKYARKYTDNIEFSCEDAGRTQIDNLCYIVEAAIKAGATTINIPDTVGYTTPYQFKKIINTLYNRVPIIDQATISVHCHNDLGMAVGNSITAIQAGARQIEGTINGIGERAGNTALEEIIMAIKIHKHSLKVHTNIQHQEIYKTSQIVSQLCNIPIPINKAIVGSNAFSHSSGIHQDGVLKNRKTYEIIEPKSIGSKEVKLNLTSRSGRAALKYHMTKMGYQENDYDINKLYNVFVKLADKQGQVFDYDLEALALINNPEKTREYFHLEYYNTQSQSCDISTALVKLKCGENIYSQQAKGYGPINAIYKALNDITNLSITLKKYQLTSKGYGYNALKQINIIVKYKKKYFHGIGLSIDIIKSSVTAMINALNSIWKAEQVEIKRQYLHNKKKMKSQENNKNE